MYDNVNISKTYNIIPLCRSESCYIIVKPAPMMCYGQLKFYSLSVYMYSWPVVMRS